MRMHTAFAFIIACIIITAGEGYTSSSLLFFKAVPACRFVPLSS